MFSGWWLCRNPTTSAQGWTPAAYVEEIAVQETRAPPPPPPPPVAPARPIPSVAINGPATNGVSARSQSPAGIAVKAKPTPPAPPAKRPTPAGGRKPVPSPGGGPRDSGVSLSAGGNAGSQPSSGRATPNSSGGGSLAGGLAEALRARQSAMSGKKEEDDDW